MQKPVLVIKLGTAVISDGKGVSHSVIKKVAAHIELTNPSQTSVKFVAFTTNNTQKVEKIESIK